MKFNAVMHVSFNTENYDEMVDFYVNKLGLKQKVVVKWKDYKGMKNRPNQAALAESDPEGIFYTYIEIAPGQFIEMFPNKKGSLKPHREWNEDCGYSHFALTVDDIYEAEKEFKAVGIQADTPISKGPSGTYQQWYHDPDGNKFELMQYTEDSYQVKGHIA